MEDIGRFVRRRMLGDTGHDEAEGRPGKDDHEDDGRGEGLLPELPIQQEGRQEQGRAQQDRADENRLGEKSRPFVQRNGVAEQQADGQDIGGGDCTERRALFQIAAVQIPGDDIGCRWEGRGDIRDQLRMRQGKEDENKGRPNQAEQHRVVKGVAFFEQAAHCRSQGRNPRDHRADKDGNEEENTVLSRMLRRDEADEIVIAEEGLQEYIAVGLIHKYVPRQADEKGDAEALGDFHRPEKGPLAGSGHIQQHDERRKGVADRAFGQQGQAAEGVGPVIFSPIQGDHGDGQGEHEGHVRDGGFADVHEADAGQQDERRHKGDGLIEQVLALDVDE